MYFLCVIHQVFHGHKKSPINLWFSTNIFIICLAVDLNHLNVYYGPHTTIQATVMIRSSLSFVVTSQVAYFGCLEVVAPSHTAAFTLLTIQNMRLVHIIKSRPVHNGHVPENTNIKMMCKCQY